MPSILSPSVQTVLLKCAKRGLLGKVIASCKVLVAEHDALQDACKKGRTRGTPSGSKAKGREGVVLARDWILRLFPDLEPDDILIQTTSVGGSDLHYSPKAAKRFPFAAESKRMQLLNVWGALHQAGVNATKKKLKPVLFFSRSNSPLYVAFKADDLVEWLKARMELSGLAEQVISQGLDNFETDDTLEECRDCDGCGWVEGGETLKTTCDTCGGSGELPKGAYGSNRT